MNKPENLIIGAGPAGIAAALSLGRTARVLEKGLRPGGIAGSIQIGEAIFDIGGHSFHTPHPFIRDIVFNSLDMFEQKRNAKIFAHGEIISYPFQRSYKELSDPEVVAECSRGLEAINNSREAGDPDNFRQYIINRFGEGISRHFMMPYNEKLWARDLSKLDVSWVKERVAAPVGINEKFMATGGQRKPLYADTTIAYPAIGGFGRIFEVLADKAENIDYGITVKKIDLTNKIVYTENAKEFSYRNLISTMPITEFIKIAKPVPPELLKQAEELEHMSLKAILLAIKHPVDTDIQRIYSADEWCPAHKVALNHNSSDWLRSRKHHAIMGEVAYSDYKKFSRNDLLDWFIDGLIRMGIIRNRGEIFDYKIIDVKYAYPVPTHDKNKIMSAITEYLIERDVHTLGRFGEWAYINSDEAMARGIVLGEKLKSN